MKAHYISFVLFIGFVLQCTFLSVIFESPGRTKIVFVERSLSANATVTNHFAKQRGNHSTHNGSKQVNVPLTPHNASLTTKSSLFDTTSTELFEASVLLQNDTICFRQVGWTPLLIVNQGFLPIFENWLLLVRKNLEQAELLLQCTLFVAIDQTSYDFISTLSFLPRKVRWFTKHNSEMHYGTEVYYNLMVSRMELIQSLLSLRVNVAIIEADQVLLKDPFQVVNALESQELHDFITYDDSKDQKGSLPCFGFMFIRSSTRSREVWNKLTNMLKTKHWKTYAGMNEQSLFQTLRTREKVSVRFLPSDQFRNGVLFGGSGNKFRAPKKRQNESGLSLVHANWVIGVKSKIELLDFHGWWKEQKGAGGMIRSTM